MRKTKLPQDLVALGQKYGMAGRRVYIPKQTGAASPDSQTLVSNYTQKLVMEVESTYEQRGVTFYLESSSRQAFSSMFSKSRIAFKFNLKLRTAARVTSATYKAWRDWFSHKERLKLEQLRDLAEEAGIDYTSLFFTYLAIRKQLRRGEEVQAGDHTGYHQVQAHVIQPVIDLAKTSIESCPWRSS